MDTKVNLTDLHTAFAYKSDRDLKMTYWVFRVLQKPMLLKSMKMCANGIIKYNLPFKVFIKSTIFRLFCAGETMDEAFGLIKKLEDYNVKSVLDYVSEGEKEQKVFEENAQTIISNIIRVGEGSTGNYISIKLTGLEDPSFLTLCNPRGFPDGRKSLKRFEHLMNRVDTICFTASIHGVTVYVDAEDWCMQNTIDFITEAMMEKYNKEKVVVFNTLQMYLKNKLNYLESLIQRAKEREYIPGIKLVRGAYMEREREEAFKEERESPVFDTKVQTDESFNTALKICLNNHENVVTCIASHNYDSNLLALELIRKLKIENHKEVVKFSQLYGMCDAISFNLAAGGYNVSKYLPYGEVKKAIPYLIRRSEENTSIDGQVNGELVRIKAEIIERKKSK